MEDNICGDVHNNCGDDCEQKHVSSGAGGQKKNSSRESCGKNCESEEGDR